MSDNDAVNHPGHYTSHPSGVECIQITEHMSFCLGNAIKYIWRADLKGNAIEDLRKARWYVDREIARLGGEPAVLDEPVAARLEAEPARDEYVEQLARVAADSIAMIYRSATPRAEFFAWDALTEIGKEARTVGIRAVLDFLAADGRLLHEGGTATVAQHENVAADQHKWVYCEYQDFARDCEFRCEAPGCDWSGQDKAGHAEHVHLIEAQERLRRNPETIARVEKAQAERHLDVRVEVTPPAASVPDSGPRTWPSLAEVPHDVVDLIDCEGYEWQHNWATTRWNGVWSGSAESSAKYGPFTEVAPDRGPDGTPEKPWPTWQDVPEGVKYRSRDRHREHQVWANMGGTRMHVPTASSEPKRSNALDSMLDELAPFVRVDGDQA
ncbi:DUF3310 domain-containing protein [Rhodococcus hoagii]|nr:DUF3310 domain-containing protein [Prescottella equi]